MRLLVFALALVAVARADALPALLTNGGFSDGEGHTAEIAVSGKWIAVIDANQSCCVNSTLSLHVLTERGKSVTEIPFACEQDSCEIQPERPRAERFLRQHHFILPGDAISLPRDESDHAHTLPFRAGKTAISIKQRTSFAVYLPSRKLLIYRWFNPNGAHAYSGVVIRHVR